MVLVCGTLWTQANELRTRLKEIKFESLDYTGVTVNDLVRQLDKKVDAADPEGRGINFILALKPDVAARTRTLDPKNVPLSGVMNLMCDVTGLTDKVDPDAVIIMNRTVGVDKTVQTQMDVRFYRVQPGIFDGACQ